MDTDANGIRGIWRKLQDKYPLLGQLVVHAIGQEEAEAFPPFFGLFLAALDAKESTPCCFVLPRREQMGRLAAIVFGLSLFRREFNALARIYAKQNFAKGERVRVHPGKHVFAFGGFWPAQPDQFRLCSLDGSGSRTFPANDILRLEPTPLVIPRGRLDTIILTPEMTPLDAVLGIRMFGNLSLVKNCVLCLDEQNQFDEFAGLYRFQRVSDSPLQTKGLEPVLNLAELLPFGWLRDSGAGNCPIFENWNTLNPNAEPLVGVTSSCDRLAAFCRSAPPRSKVVVVNGLRLLSNLQAFDDIAASQRLVLFADLDDEDRVRELEARGCRFWTFGRLEFFG